ncbi:MAG TPA: hydrogenase expression/formation protein HypE [Nitrospiria bacterium]|nr:hydrogenase expression/formation protein HypE [Nitrospiria bacterium]
MDKSGKMDISGGLSCPLPLSEYPHVLLAHGGGGKLSNQMIQRLIVPEFQNDYLEPLHDGAVVSLNGVRVAFSTDSFVVNPIFFPGGDIGELAVNGTVNDISMCGAKPLFLSAAFIVEEGFPMADLQRIVASMHRAADSAEIQLITGDTKVVDRGKADKIFINTSGMGLVYPDVDIRPGNIRAGDRVILNGSLAVHGIAIMSVREGLEFETEIKSDTAALHGLVGEMLSADPGIHVMRDLTRGGLASGLNEIAEKAGLGIHLRETDIPVGEDVRGACEILGLDPLYVANEGKFIAIVSPEVSDVILPVMRKHPLGKNARVIGEVVSDHPGTVLMKSRIGGNRVVDMLSGEQLPRIC